MGSPTLLRRAAEVTPEWLTECSPLRVPWVAVPGSARPRPPVGTGQMADTTRFALVYDTPGAGPASVVGKFASADEQSRGTGLALRAYEIEVRFYREVAGRVAARVPAAYFAEVEAETGWFTLLLQDIDGATQGDQIAACGPDVAAAVLDEMAGLHAPCWEAPELAALEWLNRGTPGGRRVPVPPWWPRCCPVSSSATRGHGARAPGPVPPLRRALAATCTSAMGHARPATGTSAWTTCSSCRGTRGPWWWTGRPCPGPGRPTTWPTSSAVASAPRTAGPTRPTCWRTTTTPSAGAGWRVTPSSSSATTRGGTASAGC